MNQEKKIKQTYSDALQKLEKNQTPKLENAQAIWGETILATISENLSFQEFAARGGQGVIIKAFDEQLLRPVAVKVALNRFNAPGIRKVDVYEANFKEDERNQFRLRFLRGAAIQAEFGHLLRDETHLGIVPIVYASSEKPCWIIQEWIDGEESLEWAQNQESIDAAIVFGWHVLRLLKRLHSFGFLHRDVKPSNILVAPDGRPVLLDFADGKDARQPSDLTASGVYLGSQMFMDFDADSKHSSYATDVYTCGAAIWALLHQRLPKTSDRTLWRQIIENKQKNWPLGGIVSPLRPVLGKALAPITERYKAIGAFLSDYQDAMQKLGIPLPTTSGIIPGKTGRITFSKQDAGGESEEFTADILEKMEGVKRETEEIIRNNGGEKLAGAYSEKWYPFFQALVLEIMEKRLNG